MPRKGLKNVVRKTEVVGGIRRWWLETLEGEPIPAYSATCELYLRYKLRSRKRYAEALSRFIDYLFEANAFLNSVESSKLNEVINAYPHLLQVGSAAFAREARASGERHWLTSVAEGLDWAPLKPSSMGSALPPVNKFLKLSEKLYLESVQRDRLLGNALPIMAPLQAVSGTEARSEREVRAMRQNSLFASVAKFAPDGLERARGLASDSKRKGGNEEHRDFPREYILPLADAALNWRDRSFWLMLAALGIRSSEAVNVLLEDIDFEAQEVRVLDSLGRRVRPADDRPNRSRFKGRQTSATFAIPGLKRPLFEAMHGYLEREFVPQLRPGEPNYFFQMIEPRRRGQPLVDVSAQALRKNFARAAERAGVPIPHGADPYAPHSLRHAYGVFWVNDAPVDPTNGVFGLPITDVQVMMGHANIRDTMRYARTKERRIAARLRAMDAALLGLSPDALSLLPSFRPNGSGGSHD